MSLLASDRMSSVRAGAHQPLRCRPS